MSLEYTAVIVGDGGVGKTSLTIFLTEGRFETEYNPTIEDTYQKIMNINNERLLLNILDTAGQEGYQLLRDQHWRSGDGFVIVFDLTNRKSFEDVTGIGEHILKSKDGSQVPIVLCGNKCDLPAREVSEEEARKLCEENEWHYFETSAKKGINVNVSFETLCKTIIEFNSGSNTAESKEEEKPKKKGLFSKLFKRK